MSELRDAAREVMEDLERYGPSIVPHLLDTDDNAGQRLRKALDEDARLRERLDEALHEWWDDDHGKGTHACRPVPSEDEFLAICERMGIKVSL